MRFLEKSDSDQVWNVSRELFWPCAQKDIRTRANSESWEPGVQNGLKCPCHKTDQGRENVGEPDHGINM